MRSLLFAIALLATPTHAFADEPLKVVASFSILSDMVEAVGGDHVAVTSLVEADEDTHVYEPVPRDVVAVAGADLVVVNGLGFEGFIDRLIEASATGAPVLVASRDVRTLEAGDDDEHGHGHGHDHDHGEEAVDPHAWQSLQAAQLYIANIASGLCAARPTDCGAFEANAAAYVSELEVLETEWTDALASIAPEQRIIISSHDAFGYLAREFDLTMLAAQGISTDAEPSAADVAGMIDQIRATGARALFVESVSDRRLLRQIADETGIAVSGTLHSDALASEGEASTYLGMMRSNLRMITTALSGS